MADFPAQGQSVDSGGAWDDMLKSYIDEPDASNLALITAERARAIAIEEALAVAIPPGGGGTPPAEFSKAGTIAAVNGRGTYPVYTPLTIAFVIIRLAMAPVGDDAIFDVQKNAFDGGGTIWTTSANRPVITDGTNYVQSLPPDITALVPGDYLTFDILQVGTDFGGSDLTALILFA